MELTTNYLVHYAHTVDSLFTAHQRYLITTHTGLKFAANYLSYAIDHKGIYVAFYEIQYFKNEFVHFHDSIFNKNPQYASIGFNIEDIVSYEKFEPLDRSVSEDDCEHCGFW